MLRSSVRLRLNGPLRLATRLAVWLTGVALLAAFVYREHLVRGQVSPAVSLPRRIVSMTLAGDEILLALIPTGRILGLSWLVDDPRYSHSVETARPVRHKVHANAEQVIALQPDLVIVSASAYTGVTARRLLRASGIPVCEIARYESFAGVQRNVLAVGRAVGALPQARRLIATMDRRLRAVRERVARAPRPPHPVLFSRRFYGRTRHDAERDDWPGRRPERRRRGWYPRRQAALPRNAHPTQPGGDPGRWRD